MCTDIQEEWIDKTKYSFCKIRTHATLNRSACPLSAFISLLDNYESDTGEPETVTPDEEAENHTFLDCMLRMPTMKVSVKTYGG